MNAATLTPEKLALHIAHDLRASSIHEAAHVVIARRYGVWADAYVIPTNTADLMEEKAFIGRTQFCRGLDEHQTRMLSLAGTVAEACDGDPDADGIELMDWIESDVFILSGTDAAGAGAYTAEDLDCCIGLVRAAWAEIETKAAQLAEQGMRFYREMQQEAAA